MRAENDWQSLKNPKGCFMKTKGWLFTLTFYHNEIPETVEAVNIVFMSWEITEQ